MWWYLGWYAPQIGLAVGKYIRRRMDRTTTYDPVYDVVSSNRKDISSGIAYTVDTARENPGVFAAAAVAVGSRLHPAIMLGSITVDFYRGAKWFESRYPGRANEIYHYQIGAYADAYRYWSGNYDFDSYSVKGDSWEEYHRQKRSKGVNPREFV